VDVKMVFRLMFGGGAFDDVFGDVCELPMLKQMVTSMDRCAHTLMHSYCMRNTPLLHSSQHSYTPLFPQAHGL
jgi:hypothetical protein